MLRQGCPELPLASGSTATPSAVPRSDQETGGREAASLVQGDSALPLLRPPPGTTLGDERVPRLPSAPLSSLGCHGPAASTGGPLQPHSPVPTPCNDAAGKTPGWEQAASLSRRAGGPSVQHGLKAGGFLPTLPEHQGAGQGHDACPGPLGLACGCAPLEGGSPAGAHSHCIAGGGACTSAGGGQLQVLMLSGHQRGVPAWGTRHGYITEPRGPEASSPQPRPPHGSDSAQHGRRELTRPALHAAPRWSCAMKSWGACLISRKQQALPTPYP